MISKIVSLLKAHKLHIWLLNIDYYILIIVIFLMILGLLEISSASLHITKHLSVSSFFFIKKQCSFIILALIIILVFYSLNITQIRVISLVAWSISIFLILITFMNGAEVKGAKRWINLIFFKIQMSEIIKPFFIVLNAYLLSLLIHYKNNFFFFISTIIYGTTASLIVFQPDVGMFFNISITWFLQIVLAGISILSIILLIILGILLLFLASLYFPHVWIRLNSFFFAQNIHNSSSNYQIYKALEAFKEGGFWGKGFLSGTVVHTLPDSHTDFILSSIGEELGFFTILLIIFAYCFIIFRSIYKASNSRNIFVKLTILSLISQIFIQVIVHIGVNARLLPTKGTTLPFLSYGGSSMISYSIIIGLLLSFYKYSNNNKIKIIHLY